jgi:aminopeptidase N
VTHRAKLALDTSRPPAADPKQSGGPAPSRAARQGLVETDDLRYAFERVTGRSFERFFRQWAYRRGVPKLKVKYSWSDADKLAEIAVTQTQPVSRETPAFILPVDLLFRVADQEIRATMQVTAKESFYRRHFDAKPESVCIDPDGGVLAGFDIDLPKAMWLEHLATGPTTVARLRAARHFRSDTSDEVIAALATALADSDAFWSIRNECAASLGEMQAPAAMEKLIEALRADEAGIADARVRRAVIDALARYETPEVAEIMVRFALSDPSYGVVAAATAALGRTTHGDVTDILLANAEQDSYNDQIRRAALQALADRDLEAGIAPARKYAAYGQYDRIRPDAIRALGRLAHYETHTEQIRRTLIELTLDPQPRARRAALEALADLGGSEAANVLRAVADSGVDQATRDTARAALARVDAAKPDGPAAAALRREIARVRDEFQKVRDRVQKLESRLPTRD